MCLIILITRPNSRNFNALSFNCNSPPSLLRTILNILLCPKQCAQSELKMFKAFVARFMKLIVLEESISYQKKKGVIVETYIYQSHIHTYTHIYTHTRDIRIEFGTSLPYINQVAHTKMLESSNINLLKDFDVCFDEELFRTSHSRTVIHAS